MKKIILILFCLPLWLVAQQRADQLPEIESPADTDIAINVRGGSFFKTTFANLKTYFNAGAIDSLTLRSDSLLLYTSNDTLFVDLSDYAKDTDIPTLVSELTNDSGYLIAEVDGSVTNEIQTISIDSSGTSFTITLSNGGGSVTFEDSDTGGSGIGGTLTDEALPKYDSTAGEFVGSGLSDNDTTLTVDRHIKQQRTYYPSTLRTTTSGSDTIVIVNTGIQRLCSSVTFVYVRLSYFDQQTTTLAQQGTISCRIRIDNAGATPQDGYIQVVGDWNVTLEGKVGYDNTTDEAVISFRAPVARYIVERIDFTTDAADFNPDNISITGVSTETGYTLSSAEMTNRAFVIGAQAEDQEFDGNVVGLAISNSNTGGTNNSVSFHMIASHGPDASGQELTRGVKFVAHKNSTGATSGHDLAIELPTASDSDSPVERFRFQAEGQLGIQTTTPAYTLDLGASNSSIRLTPHDTALPSAEGVIYASDIENRPAYDDGNSVKYISLKTDTGWAQYGDSSFTEGSPLTVSSGDTITLPIDALSGVIESYLPSGIDSLWSASDSTIIAAAVGDAYTVRVNFIASSDNVNGYFTQAIDIGDTSPTWITSRVKTFPKGSGVAHNISSTDSVYSLSTFVANGGKIKIAGGTGTTSIWGISILITRVHAQ